MLLDLDLSAKTLIYQGFLLFFLRDFQEFFVIFCVIFVVKILSAVCDFFVNAYYFIPDIFI